MRRLTKFKIGGSRYPVYTFAWEDNKDDGVAPEIYTYQGTEPPDPALIVAAREVGIMAAKMVSIHGTDSDFERGAAFHGLIIEYPKQLEGYQLRVQASMTYPWNGYTFKYVTPAWRVYHKDTFGDFNTKLRETVLKLMQECWKYIDGERAQVQLFEGGQDSH